METIGEMTLEDAARRAAGNWQSWTCFVWFRDDEICDPSSWSIIYTHNRDSGLLKHSNAEVVAKALNPFTRDGDSDVVFESQSHWAVGHVQPVQRPGLPWRRDHGRLCAHHGLSEWLAEYPILDESDYAKRELDATIDNLDDACWRLKSPYELPDGWNSEVYSWLSENRPGSVKNRDDRGGYPSEAELREALDSLGYAQVGV